MSEIFKKTIKGKRLSEGEIDFLKNELSAVKSALLNNTFFEVALYSSTASALLLYGKQDENQQDELLNFIHWIDQPTNEETWSEKLNAIISRYFNELQTLRIGKLIEKISLQKSLTSAENASELISSLHDKKLTGLYENKVDELGIDFTVSILPFNLEVLDPRIVTVKPGKANEMHKHAHETVFIFLKGKGKVLVDNFENEVYAGDFAFIPRWCDHQSINTGTEDLVFLAVADFGLTGKSFVGNYLKTARLKAQ
ncbi:MAG: cupin domain-containing protein [Flavobacteriia bacterium]|jgi:quercetin dioxygenase-like cupin family protein